MSEIRHCKFRRQRIFSDHRNRQRRACDRHGRRVSSAIRNFARSTETLSPEELDCAIRHERAHRTSGDNFKRLLLLLAPDVFPFFSMPFSAMDRSWITFSEWAADDSAVANDLQRSLSLAGALVHVAQMGAAPRLSPLCTSLVSSNSACMNQDLSARVDRLLHTAPLRQESPKRFRAISSSPQSWRPARFSSRSFVPKLSIPSTNSSNFSLTKFSHQAASPGHFPELCIMTSQ